MSFHDSSYSSYRWGVPLTPAETANVDARAETAGSIDEAADYAMTLDDYAGVYLDQARGGIPVFLFSGDHVDQTGEIARRLPPGAHFSITEVPVALHELRITSEAVYNAREDLLRQGIQITSVGVDMANNGVFVGVADLTSAKEARLAERFGPSVQVDDEPVAEADACAASGTTIKDCWPMKAGLQILQPSSGRSCTAGFVGKITQPYIGYVVVTAGHCLPATSGTSWSHSGNTIGTEQDHTWTQAFDPGADAGYIDYSPPAGDRNGILIKNNDNWIGHITGTQFSAHHFTGVPICRMGYGSYLATGSPKSCGTIVNQDVRKKSCYTPPSGGSEVCAWILHETVVSFDSVGGDSGGPYYFNPDDPNADDKDHTKIYGIHTHSGPDDVASSKGWFSPIDKVTAELYSQHGDLISVCVTPTC
jgi:hypothetical protein